MTAISQGQTNSSIGESQDTTAEECRAIPSSRSVAIERRNFIAIDFGSESISAFYKKHDETEISPIDLQASARMLLQIDHASVAPAEIDYLKEADGRPSKRMRNRFSLRHRVQGAGLDDRHAHLIFIGNEPDGRTFPLKEGETFLYKTSLFEFFHLLEESIKPESLPNPKMTFQYGAKKLIPIIKSIDGFDTQYEPKEILKHLMLQLINNFILNSTEIRRRRIDAGAENTWLLITIPNIYSLTHANEIVDYLKKSSVFGDRVEYLYESEAMAYFMGSMMNQNEKARRFIGRARAKYDLLSIDIGHGTTDLSLVQIEALENKYYIRARTGRAEGGGKLNYLLATHFNSCLREIIQSDEYKAFDGDNDLLSGVQTTGQCRFLRLAEDLVVDIKKTMDSRYRVQSKEQEGKITALGNAWIDALDDPHVISSGDRQRFTRQLVQESRIDSLPSPLQCSILLKLPDSIVRRNPKWRKARRLARLRETLEGYVESNSMTLIKDLLSMAGAREARRQAYAIDPRNTLAVLSGQAAQFEPLRAAVIRAFKKIAIPLGNQAVLIGGQSKDGCAIGAIVNKYTYDCCENPREIHGIFGLAPKVLGQGPTMIFDTLKLNLGEDVELAPHVQPSTQVFFFAPCSQERMKVRSRNAISAFDSGVSLIAEISGASVYRARYDCTTANFTINGQAGIRVETYGGQEAPPFEKAWPEKLA